MRDRQQAADQPRLREILSQWDVIFETFCWTAAWLIIPAWLAVRGAGFGEFAVYALAAGLLLSVGGVAAGSPSFDEPWALAGHTTLSCVAIFLAGGLVFGVTAALL